MAGLVGDRFKDASVIKDKHERNAAVKAISKEIKNQLLGEFRDEKVSLETLAQVEARQAEAKALGSDLGNILHDMHGAVVREMVLNGSRIDGRAHDEIRPIAASVGVVPRAHGTGLFTRGETQVLSFATLGSREDEQMIDALAGKHFNIFKGLANSPAALKATLALKGAIAEGVLTGVEREVIALAIGGIQPKILADCFAPGRFASGLVPRILIACPPRTSMFWTVSLPR